MSVQQESRREGRFIKESAITISHSLVQRLCVDRTIDYFKMELFGVLPANLVGPLTRKPLLAATYVTPYYESILKGSRREEEFAASVADFAATFTVESHSSSKGENFEESLLKHLSTIYSAELSSSYCVAKYIDPYIRSVQEHFENLKRNRKPDLAEHKALSNASEFLFEDKKLACTDQFPSPANSTMLQPSYVFNLTSSQTGPVNFRSRSGFSMHQNLSKLHASPNTTETNFSAHAPTATALLWSVVPEPIVFSNQTLIVLPVIKEETHPLLHASEQIIEIEETPNIVCSFGGLPSLFMQSPIDAFKCFMSFKSVQTASGILVGALVCFGAYKLVRAIQNKSPYGSRLNGGADIKINLPTHAEMPTVSHAMDMLQMQSSKYDLSQENTASRNVPLSPRSAPLLSTTSSGSNEIWDLYYDKTDVVEVAGIVLKPDGARSSPLAYLLPGAESPRQRLIISSDNEASVDKSPSLKPDETNLVGDDCDIELHF